MELMVAESNESSWDQWARRHPRWTVAAVLALAVLATVILLSRSEGPVVLYQAF